MPQPDWNDVRYFLEVARLGSLSAAARALEVEHSTVSRRIAALERQLGLRLFERLPQAWRPTVEAEALLPHARRLEEEALALTHAARERDALAGVVRVSAPPAFAAAFLVPRLAAPLAQWPALELQLLGETRESDLARREADVALRLRRPDDPRLAGRPLAELGYGLYAHPRWRDMAEGAWRFLRHGDPRASGETARWLDAYAGERPCAFSSNDLLALREAAANGLGIALLPHVLGRLEPRLVAIDACSIRRPLWLVVHPEVRRSPRVARVGGLIADIVSGAAELLG